MSLSHKASALESSVKVTVVDAPAARVMRLNPLSSFPRPSNRAHHVAQIKLHDFVASDLPVFRTSTLTVTDPSLPI